MRILICTDNFYPGIGGTEAAVLSYAEELIAEGHEVMLACPKYRTQGERYPFEVVRFPSLRIIKNVPIVFTHGSRKKMKRLVAFSPDIVHLETLAGMAKIGLRVGKACSVPVVMTMHTKLLYAYMGFLKSERLSRLLLHVQLKRTLRCDALVTVARCMLPELESYHCPYEGDIRIIRNGSVFRTNIATEEERLAARRELGIGEQENVLAFVGRLQLYKNIVFVLKCLRLARERGFSFRYLVVGDGDDREEIQREAQSLGLSDAVLFTGLVSDRSSIRKYYAAADLFVTASVFDTDPIVVMEAASVGVPSLVAEHSGCSERIEDGKNGYTAPLDEGAFCSRIMEAFADKEVLREVGVCAAQTVLSTWADTVKSNLELYNQLIHLRKQKTICTENQFNTLNGGGCLPE